MTEGNEYFFHEGIEFGPEQREGSWVLALRTFPFSFRFLGGMADLCGLVAFASKRGLWDGLMDGSWKSLFFSFLFVFHKVPSWRRSRAHAHAHAHAVLLYWRLSEKEG
jgi:hypothetical protein